MNTITINKTEYEKLIDAKRMLDSVLKAIFMEREKNNLFEAGKFFGALKGNFGDENSISYISKIRKSWRE